WLALQFGLRFSEILGLQWKNIDFKNKILHVEQAYHEPEKELGRLKTNASRRSISMSDQQVEFLKEYKEKQTPKSDIVVANSQGKQAYHETEKQCGRLKTNASRRSISMSDQQVLFLKEYKEKQTPKSDIVVANSQGNYMMKRNVRRAMNRICERAEVKQITF